MPHPGIAKDLACLRVSVMTRKKPAPDNSEAGFITDMRKFLSK
jgi:hypothetical protein